MFKNQNCCSVYWFCFGFSFAVNASQLLDLTGATLSLKVQGGSMDNHHDHYAPNGNIDN